MSLLLQSSRATLPCRSYCSSSCCSFSEPAAECAGCDSTKACNPVAKCYQASTRPPPPPPLRTTAGVCEFVCEKASCCGFSQPATSCAGCFEPYACRPGTDCYELGSATPKHQRRVERQAELAPRPAGMRTRRGAGSSRSTNTRQQRSSGGSRGTRIRQPRPAVTRRALVPPPPLLLVQRTPSMVSP